MAAGFSLLRGSIQAISQDNHEKNPAIRSLCLLLSGLLDVAQQKPSVPNDSLQSWPMTSGSGGLATSHSPRTTFRESIIRRDRGIGPLRPSRVRGQPEDYETRWKQLETRIESFAAS